MCYLEKLHTKYSDKWRQIEFILARTLNLTVFVSLPIFSNNCYHSNNLWKYHLAEADPGFPFGGCQPSLEGASTSDTGTFW